MGPADYEPAMPMTRRVMGPQRPDEVGAGALSRQRTGLRLPAAHQRTDAVASASAPRCVGRAGRLEWLSARRGPLSWHVDAISGTVHQSAGQRPGVPEGFIFLVGCFSRIF